MHLDDDAVPVDVALADPAGVDIDVLILPTPEHEDPPRVGVLPDAVTARLRDAVASRAFTGKAGSVFSTPVDDPGWRPRRILLAGIGKRDVSTADDLRRAATAAALAARDGKLRRVGLLLPGIRSGAEEARAAAEGLLLAAYHTGSHKTEADALPVSFERFVVLSGDADASGLIAPAAARGAVLGACSNLARALANEPGNLMTPSIFADLAADIGRSAGLAVDVLDEAQIEALGMRLLLGVGRGSVERPRVVVLRYEPAHPRDGVLLALVGKGVTFDAGGISLKGSDGMFRMKNDMSGGAAVVAAMKAMTSLAPDIRVVGIVPLVENMPGGRALKPGDVVRSADGKTVEILDTDAEGRLILADALWYARTLGATHLVDVATLTGAIGVALGRTTTGLFGAPAWWTDLVGRTAAEAGDRTWLMPLFDDYRDQLRSDIADLTNVGGRPAGSITAAMFLKEFTGGLPWAHLDIASTAWAEEARPHQPKGPTGVAVRTLALLAETAGEWR